MEAVEETIILIASIVAVTLILAYTTVSYSNYSRYLIAHEELANIVFEAYGFTIGNSTIITLGNLGRVNAYVESIYALTNSSGKKINLNSILEYLTYTTPNSSKPIIINNRLLLEPGHVIIIIINGHYSGISVKACPTQESNTCNWVTLRWIITEYETSNKSEAQALGGKEGSVTIVVTNDSLSIPWSISVNVNGPGGYSYQRSGSEDYTWVQYLTNSLQYINSSISLINYLLKLGNSLIYRINGNYYECIAEPNSYGNVRSGSIIFTINCKTANNLLNWAVFLSGLASGSLTISDPTFTLNQGWNTGLINATSFNAQLTLTLRDCYYITGYWNTVYCPVSLNGTMGYWVVNLFGQGSFTLTARQGSTTPANPQSMSISWSSLKHLLYIILTPGYSQSPYYSSLIITNDSLGARWNLTAQPWGTQLASGSGNYQGTLGLPGNPVNLTISPLIQTVNVNGVDYTCFWKPT
ncbi:MAG: hypothetical protein ACP5L1_09660, partial [Caldivirga sp.]|uniref:hypothetical protein n=1 Tax=Caldivirga sp. TaxID=2080243 RepID=UPI003D142F6C